MAAFKLGVHYSMTGTRLEPMSLSLIEQSDNVWWRYRPSTNQQQPLSLQLYSEYRSTYKWHEVTGGNSNASNSNEVVVVKRPPKPISGKYFSIVHVFNKGGLRFWECPAYFSVFLSPNIIIQSLHTVFKL